MSLSRGSSRLQPMSSEYLPAEDRKGADGLVGSQGMSIAHRPGMRPAPAMDLAVWQEPCVLSRHSSPHLDWRCPGSSL